MATKEAYDRMLANQNERYANDEEFRERRKEYSRNRFRQMMSDPNKHMEYCERRRKYFREYQRKRNKKK